MSFSDYLEAKLLNLIVNDISFAVLYPYIGLWIGSPGEGGASGAEVSGVGYDRVDSTGDWGSASNGVVTNTGRVAFATAEADWGTVTHFVICDTPGKGTGNVLLYGALTPAKEIPEGSIPEFLADSLVITLS